MAQIASKFSKHEVLVLVGWHLKRLKKMFDYGCVDAGFEYAK